MRPAVRPRYHRGTGTCPAPARYWTTSCERRFPKRPLPAISSSKRWQDTLDGMLLFCDEWAGRHRSGDSRATGEKLSVITNTAAEIPGLRDECYLRNGRVIGSGPWKHVGDLAHLAFRLLRRRG